MSDFALAPTSSAAEGLVLDTASSSANRLEAYRQDIEDGRAVALDFITEIQFQDHDKVKADAFGSIERSDAASAELLGKDPKADEPMSNPQTERLMDTLQDLYLATAKTAIAWKVVEGVGKDTKAMLQTQ
ncbi:MAG: hypothetical protein KBT70_11025 [Roseovarius sp.]|uniref:hypothetical protein n=1 Tax=Roseovarius sp. TaxID=1486281 RepID=UPI0019CE9F5C|nr:hypothetical protein [Roseovarius sp.]MBC7179243.1 hypothetical protein [Roseovarius sp.]MBQ0750720.1 hypothetical protein [Roseovarius sp.]MBQ0811845.1 hypothetical protein [Roseovarius sp.]